MTAASPWAVGLRGALGAFAIDIAFDAETPCVVVIGPNGSGKTTLVRAIAGAELGMRGRVAVAGTVLQDSNAGVALAPEARNVGYVPQGYGLFPHMTVLENVAFGCGRGSDARERARASLADVGAAELAERRPDALSGGERQRVALARAIARRPAALLLDEPLAALDPTARRGMRAFLADTLGRLPCPTLVVTHDARDVRALGGTVVAIERGRVVQVGTPDAVRAAPATDFVAEFFDLGD